MVSWLRLQTVQDSIPHPYYVSKVCSTFLINCVIWAYAQMHKCTNAHMHICTYAHLHICTYAHMHICTYDIGKGYGYVPANIEYPYIRSYIEGYSIFSKMGVFRYPLFSKLRAFLVIFLYILYSIFGYSSYPEYWILDMAILIFDIQCRNFEYRGPNFEYRKCP